MWKNTQKKFLNKENSAEIFIVVNQKKFKISENTPKNFKVSENIPKIEFIVVNQKIF